MATSSPQSDRESQADWDVIVVGAGAAGLLAAATAAERGRRTLLLEKNTKPGVKILMSGGTRCNLTQDTDESGIIAAFGNQGRFLHSPLASLGPRALVDFFHQIGVPTKVESTGKIFPQSDRALDVQQALVRHARDAGVEMRLQTPVAAVQPELEGRWQVGFANAPMISTHSLIVTVGGMSYPGCGTTGDGFDWARQLGHRVITPRPALTPLVVRSPWVRDLAGVTLPHVKASVAVLGELGEPLAGDTQDGFVSERRRTIRSERNEASGGLLFTHFGVSGPVPMNISHLLTQPGGGGPFGLVCDWLPDESTETTERRLQERAGREGGSGIGQVIADQLPKRLADHLLHAIGIDRSLRLAELSKRHRRLVAGMLHGFVLPLSGTKGFAKAEVTAGGVSLKEVRSTTMESKLHNGLYFAGEILDLDGPIGGYNFQSAFSTGYLAGLNA